MKQKSRRTSANLSEIAFIIYSKLERVRPYGWFSKFVSDKLVEHYYKDFEKKILTEHLVELQQKRNKFDEECKKIVKKLKRLKRIK